MTTRDTAETDVVEFITTFLLILHSFILFILHYNLLFYYHDLGLAQKKKSFLCALQY